MLKTIKKFFSKSIKGENLLSEIVDKENKLVSDQFSSENTNKTTEQSEQNEDIHILQTSSEPTNRSKQKTQAFN